MRKLKPVKTASEPAAPEDTFELLERLPVPMYVKSRDGRYLGVNKAWEELFGVTRESFVGKQVRDLYPQNPEIAELHAARDSELWHRAGARGNGAARERGAFPRGGGFGERGHADLRPLAQHHRRQPRGRAHRRP